MAQHASKKQRTQPQYELLYHPGIPGRGEFVRLAFEAAGVPYTDVANESPDGYGEVQRTCMSGDDSSADGNPPVFSPPALRVRGAGPGGAALLIAQTPNILVYLGEKLGLVPDGEGEGEGEGEGAGRFHVAQVAMTALDFNDEAHDTHHPVAVAAYYEEQKEEALRKAADFRASRVPKFLSYFMRVLGHNERDGGGEGRYLVGKKLTFADTTVWQVLDGLLFAFPKEMQARREEFPALLGKFYEGIKEEPGLKEYLSSKTRLPYSMGIFRHYPELDRQ